MSWIWILPVLLGVTLVATLFPLFSRRGGAPLPAGLEGDPRAELEDRRDILLRQLKELTLSDGIGDPGDTREARRDLEEELGALLDRLHALEQTQTAAKPDVGALSDHKGAPSGRRTAAAAIGVALALAMSALSGGLYLLLGTPSPPASATASRAASHRAGGADLETLVANLATRLQQHPEDLEGHLRLARTYAYLGKAEGAIAAYTHILSRDPQNLDATSGLAATLVESEQEEQIKRGIKLFRDVLERKPDHPEALWVMGSVAFRVGDREQALARWRKLLEQVAPDSPAREELEEAIREAEALPATRTKPAAVAAPSR
ncbi:MAG: tetratricopeptide repeat protein [Magnetococcales bacterium]|nr:tetratricopeptide repeat protein [Magnetococcales bacterium]